MANKRLTLFIIESAYLWLEVVHSIDLIPLLAGYGIDQIRLAGYGATHAIHVILCHMDVWPPTMQVRDAGRTEVAPGSETVLAIAGMSEVVDQVTAALPTV